MILFATSEFCIDIEDQSTQCDNLLHLELIFSKKRMIFFNIHIICVSFDLSIAIAPYYRLIDNGIITGTGSSYILRRVCARYRRRERLMNPSVFVISCLIVKFSYCIPNISFSSRHDVSVIDIINSRGKSNFRIRARSAVIIWWSDHEAIVDSIYFLGTYDHSFYLTCKLVTAIFRQGKGDISTFSSPWRRNKY